MSTRRRTQTRSETKLNYIQITKMFTPPDIECLKCGKLCQLPYQEFCVDCLASFMVSVPKRPSEVEYWKFENVVNYLFTKEEYSKYSVGAINRAHHFESTSIGNPCKSDGPDNLKSDSEKSLSSVSKSSKKFHYSLC